MINKSDMKLFFHLVGLDSWTMLLESALLVAVVSLAAVAFICFKKPQNLPPGPKPLPLLGNALDILPFMPDIHLGFTKLAKDYGDLFMLYLQGICDDGNADDFDNKDTLMMLMKMTGMRTKISI